MSFKSWFPCEDDCVGGDKNLGGIQGTNIMNDGLFYL